MNIAVDIRTDSIEADACEPAALNLPAELGIYAAADVYRDMSGLLDTLATQPGRAALRIDAHRVELVDASGVQLLIAFAAEVQGRGLSVQWIDPSRALCDGAARLGVATMLRLNADTAAA